MATERLNKIVYSQLATATVEGVAYHLVSKVEETKNGHAAWKNLVEWYNGDMILNKTTENLRNKLDNLRLHMGISASEYINKFLAWFRDLEKIKGEGVSPGHAMHLFLKNIIDNNYKTSVTYCRNTGCSLDLCIAAMRKQERDIQQKKTDRQRMKATLHRMKNPQESGDELDGQNKKRQKISNTRHVATMNDKAENEKFGGELDTTEKGLLWFKGDCWKKMEEKEKDFVRDYNASIKHGDPTDKLAMPEGITIKTRPRRTRIKEEPETE
jgi:gag-polypeptide of LTR copia-type